MGNDPPQNQQPQPISQQVQQKNVPIIQPISTIQQDDDIYILQDLSTMSLKGNRKKHFWVDPRIFNGQNQKYLDFLQKSLDIQGKSSVADGLMKQLQNLQMNQKVKVVCAASLKDQQYKTLQNDSRIRDIFLFCQNQERAKLLMSNFSKIRAAKFDIVQLRDFLVTEQSADQEGGDVKTNILVMVEEDTSLMNKYRINFHSLTTGKSKIKARADYVNFIKKVYPENISQINQFQQNYKLNLPQGQKQRQTLFWLSKNGFFWNSTQTLPKITTDPKKLAYLRFPFKQIYEAISKQYKSKPPYLSQVFIVFTPTKQQLDKMKENITNFLIFTSFTKGYTQQKQAKQAMKKNPNSFLIRVMMKLPPKINQTLDFGYQVLNVDKNSAQAIPDVIFNIYNVFQIQQFEQQLKQFTFKYGSLAQVAFIREFNRSIRLGPFQQNLLRNYDYLQDIISRIDSQATILQMSGHFQDSLRIYNQKLQNVRKSQPPQQVLDRCTIELGDAYRINQQYKKAQQQFMSIKQGKMALIAKVHLAELYFKSKQTDKLDKIIGQIEKNVEQYKNISQPDSFKAQNYIGMNLMNRGKYKQANILYKTLLKQINLYYKFKYEGIPMVHQIYRNRATCETKLSNFGEALSLLDSTKGWQIVCEGNKSPSLAITQNLIKSIHESRGQKKQAQKCDLIIKKIQQEAPRDENLYLSRSGVFINLNESVINIQTSNASQNPPQQFKVEPPMRLIEQSAFTIDL